MIERFVKLLLWCAFEYFYRKGAIQILNIIVIIVIIIIIIIIISIIIIIKGCLKTQYNSKEVDLII